MICVHLKGISIKQEWDAKDEQGDLEELKKSFFSKKEVKELIFLKKKEVKELMSHENVKWSIYWSV